MKIGIIGGGPGGTVTAARLAHLGHDVHLYEAVEFPRFHIGESLLPCNRDIFAAVGLTEADFINAGFPVKHAAHFEQATTGAWVRFPFSEGLPGDPPTIFQVDRAQFDHTLLKRALSLGVTLHCPVRVTAIDLTNRAIVHAQGQDTFDFIADCSGRETLLAKQQGWLDRANDLRRAAVFGHLTDYPLAPGAALGDISIVKADVGWCWQIPLAANRWSIGLVLKRDAIQAHRAHDHHEADPSQILRNGSSASARFAANLCHFPAVAERLNGRLPEPIRSIPNISYRVTKRVGPRCALLGDAGGFIDPIFSSGVLLATRAGLWLADTLHEQGADADLTTWTNRVDHDLRTFFAFIRLWYDGHFIDNLFFGTQHSGPFYHGIISLLGGNTTHPDNAFLKLLHQRAADPTWGMPPSD